MFVLLLVCLCISACGFVHVIVFMLDRMFLFICVLATVFVPCLCSRLYMHVCVRLTCPSDLFIVLLVLFLLLYVFASCPLG